MKLPQETDFAVVGAGVAGLRAAVDLASAGRVLVLAKRELSESATQYAQGGIAAALSDEDELSLHLQDTLDAGAGLCNVDAAKLLVSNAPERIQELIDWGTQFDREGTRLAFTREGAHSRDRVLHAQGDSTGREISRALYAKVNTLPNVSVMEFEFTRDLWVEDGSVCGIILLDEHGLERRVSAQAVLLATGGLGQVYSETTNPAVATADGVAMACRAGAEVMDMEFVQFHPTALYLKHAPRFLLSEALRGEGAYLRNAEMTRFMSKYHPAAELAPRDVVARAIWHEMEICRGNDPCVYLDLTHLDEQRVHRRFPRIYSTCMQYNVDITTDLVPVRPAAHYAMGGVRTGLDGRTNLPGLFAAGEVACTGVHGANRLASNSLLEGLVFGARAAQAMCGNARRSRPSPRNSGDARPVSPNSSPDDAIRAVRLIAWKNLAIVRMGGSLRDAIQQLEDMRDRLPAPGSRRACEANNLWQAALLIAKSALARLESRGAHYRMDYPTTDDAKFRKHTVVTAGAVRFESI